jgi:hypothetical protein
VQLFNVHCFLYSVLEEAVWMQFEFLGNMVLMSDLVQGDLICLLYDVNIAHSMIPWKESIIREMWCFSSICFEQYTHFLDYLEFQIVNVRCKAAKAKTLGSLFLDYKSFPQAAKSKTLESLFLDYKSYLMFFQGGNVLFHLCNNIVLYSI